MISDTLGLLICENYKREAAAVIRGKAFADVKVFTFPAVCRSSRQKKKELSEFIPAGIGSHIAFIGSECSGRFKPLTGKKIQLKLKKPEHCAYMFINKTVIDWYLKKKAYILTPGYLDRWRNCIKEMGLDQKSAGKFFSGSFSGILMLDTGKDRSSKKNLQQFSRYLNLPAETMPVGLDHFRLFLNEIVLEWRLKSIKMKERLRAANVERRKQERIYIDRTCLVEINESDMVSLKDISLGGARLYSDRPLPADSVHIVTIFPSIKKEIHLTGTVAWLSSTQSPAGSHSYEIGIKFNEISEDSRSSLEKFFSSIAS